MPVGVSGSACASAIASCACTTLHDANTSIATIAWELRQFGFDSNSKSQYPGNEVSVVVQPPGRAVGVNDRADDAEQEAEQLDGRRLRAVSLRHVSTLMEQCFLDICTKVNIDCRAHELAHALVQMCAATVSCKT